MCISFRLLRLALLLTLAMSHQAFPADSVVKLKRDENFFPLAVWLQSPGNAERYKAAGINTYVGLWKGPTEEQFNQLKTAGFKIVCDQNAVGLAHKDDPTIIAWMQEDEPDNAQYALKGYGPPVNPTKVIARYDELHKADSSRPVLLNLGQGVAYDYYIGRGMRRNHPEDYAEYVKGGDVVSFDIYPVTHPEAAIRGKLEYVANGVQRLKKWAGPDREVWNCVEARIGDSGEHVKPEQLRAEVWMSIINGSRGLIYFVHQFKPKFREASIFDDPDLLKELTEVNKRITELAPVLNSGETIPVITVTKPLKSPIAAMAKKRGNDIYVFAVGMSREPMDAALETDTPGKYTIEVLDESRTIETSGARVFDKFDGYQAHLYKLTPTK